jgi:hypothetical protein
MPSPQVEKKLSAAGGQDSGSPSAQARTILGQEIAGLNSTALQVVVHVSQGAVATDPQAQTVLSRATTLLKADHRISNVITPQPGARSRRTAGRPSSRPAPTPMPTRWSGLGRGPGTCAASGVSRRPCARRRQEQAGAMCQKGVSGWSFFQRMNLLNCMNDEFRSHQRSARS